MNRTLRDAFARQLDDAGRLDVDLDALIDRGETRLRRRRLAAVLGAAAAVVLVLAALVGVTGSHLVGRGDGPVDHPPTPVPTPNPTRPIVYSDVRFVPGDADSLLGDPIHVGDRLVDTGSGFIHMDVTDDGVVYTTGGYLDDGRVWFTDGGTPTQIGSHACPDAHGWAGTVVTGNTGSLAAWVDCTPGQDPALVVYDTGSSREVVRERLTRGGVHAIIGDHVYFTSTHHDGDTTSLLELDVATDRISMVKLRERAGTFVPFSDDEAAQSQAYLDDIRSHPRGLVLGDSWETGTPSLFGQGFAVVGRQLVPSSDGPHPSVFDIATRQPIRLHLPPGYQADHDELGGIDFGLFEWLDDDTVALEGSGGRQDGDILSCRLSSGRCELAGGRLSYGCA